MNDSVDLDTRLQQFLENYPAPSYLIAFSGGLDSHVLLHNCAALLAAQASFTVRAIHIDHGLQAESADWAQHCQQVCADLNIPLRIISLKLQTESGQSLEALAREARYQAFAEHLLADEILLTAHHQDDQAETLLLNLLRGAGTAGLAAMPESRPFQHTLLCRPLLDLSRQNLAVYAQSNGLKWIEDPSNQDASFDRNYLRQEILPRLQQRWPAVSQVLARAAQWQAESHELLSTLLVQKLDDVVGSQPDTLSVNELLQLKPAMQKSLLRQWLQQLGFRMPAAMKLDHILYDVLQAKSDAKPCVSWSGCEVRRYRGDVYALKPAVDHNPAQVYYWPDLTQPLDIPALGLTLEQALLAELLSYLPEADIATLKITVAFRRGGEKLTMSSGSHHSLKKFFQEQAIPPWQRSRIPLLMVGKEIISIPGYFTLTRSQLLSALNPEGSVGSDR